jgi:hypothetical protein
MNEPCTWCGAEVEPDDGFRAYLLPAATNTAAGSTGERRAVFCRLEHLIPWSIQGAHWICEGAPSEARSNPSYGGAVHLSTCSHCDAELTDAHVLLVRHRGEHRVGDAFCSVDHMTEWAKAGGRWG